MPIDDTLNIKNGMNYAQFLSAILRIGYLKAEASGDQSSQSYKNALDAMFQNQNIDVAKRQAADPTYNQVYSLEANNVFFEFQVTLSAIFTCKSVKLGDTFLLMSKHEFVGLVNEIGLFVVPKKKSAEEEKKEKEALERQAQGQQLTPDQVTLLQNAPPSFQEAEVFAAIASVSSFDADQLDYYNFLEAIIRTTKARPWTEEEEKEMGPFSEKLKRVCSLMEVKYAEEFLKEFEMQREAFERERKYQPRIVVDDEEIGGSDEEDNL